MRKVLGIILFTLGLGAVAMSFTTSGCGHHHRRYRAAIVSSSTNSILPSNTIVVLRQPAEYDQTSLLEEIVFELREFNDREEEISVIVEVDNNISPVVSVSITNETVVIYPDKTKKCPRLYHWLKKVKKSKCKRVDCPEESKPCDNED